MRLPPPPRLHRCKDEAGDLDADCDNAWCPYSEDSLESEVYHQNHRVVYSEGTILYFRVL